MAKKYVKMAIYAEPGVGKSTFASKAPNVFFITTDGNFGWLGLPDEQHVQIYNGPQFEKVVDLMGTPEFDSIDTVVVDLLEDAYLMCEQSFCKKHKIETLADMDWGKGYDVVRKGFITTISKLIGLPKHILFLMHGEDDVSTKDVRGNVITKHVPSAKLPKKVLSSVEGKVQYFLRAYVKAETSSDPNNPKVYKRRYLSLIPKPNDYGISRGADENNFPEDIELDWDTFAEVIGLNEGTAEAPKKSALQELIDSISDAPVRPNVATKPNIAPTVVAPKPAATVAPKPATPTPTKPVATKPAPAKVEEVVEETAEEEITLNKANETEETVAPKVSKTDVLAKLKAKKAVEEAPKVEETVEEEPVKEEAPKPTPTATASKPVNQSDVAAKLAALKAKSKR